MFAMRGRRYVIVALIMVVVTAMLLLVDKQKIPAHEYIDKYLEKDKSNDGRPKPKYLPEPEWSPPPIIDPFPLLSTSAKLPSIPKWNVPAKNLWKKYDLPYAPPLFIGFTRTWPLLLQAVVSYITAGWPADQIYVIENTGVQRANAEGKLTLQNPFYLNHAQLKKLGVNIIQAPVLMSFAQLQNYYMYLSHEMDKPYYFWSHMDVLVLSYEDGFENLTPKSTEQGFKSLYELCLAEMSSTLKEGEPWAQRFFAYDHLTLVNRHVYEEMGGWDTMIPYYMTDCDMHSRLIMQNYTAKDVKAGIITDVSTALTDLLALYRDESVEVDFTDPNPPAPKRNKNARRDLEERDDEKPDPPQLAYWKKLRDKADTMWHYKHADRDRNVWQVGQKGGQGEPFYYPARGIAKGIEVLTEAGREVYRNKWGHRDCDLISGAGLGFHDQWRVAKDFFEPRIGGF